MRFPLIAPLFLLVAMSASPVFAQSPNGNINGLVSDPSSAAVAGAEVVAVNDVTSVQYTTKANNEGIYVLPSLPPGPYRLQVSKAGFKTVIKPDIVLNVQDALSVNFTLPVGAAFEILTVEGGAPLVNTQSAAVGTVVDRQFVENIPLNGRSFQALINLTPGVVVVPGGSNSFGQFSVNGQRASANSFTVDGVSANFGAEPGTFGAPANSGSTPGFTAFGTTQSLASIDALQEFKVQTSTYSAEYGRQPGGQVSIVTRSGTNQFHGSVFEYFRNDVLDANDWFADRAGQSKPAERQNDFGGTLGGPVIIPGRYNGHNHTFFFFSYEGLRLRQPQFTLTNVPTLALRREAPTGMQPILNAFPLPNGKDLGNGLAELNAGYSIRSMIDATSVRIDHTFNSKLTLFARYNKAPSESIARGSVLSRFQSSRLSTQTITLGVTCSLTPKASNEFRVNYSGNGAYQGQGIDNFGGALPPLESVLIPTQYDSSTAQGSIYFPFPGLTADAPLLNVNRNSVASQRQFNVIDSVSYAFGSHQLKFGIDYRRLTPVVAFNTYGLFATFSSKASVLTATADSGFVAASIPLKPVFLNFSAYGQDTWRVSPRLTFDLGLRWDVNPAPSEANGNLPIAVNEITNLATMQLAPLGTKEWKTTYSNVAPRLGFAYQVSQASERETVVRGGFGIFYDAGNDLAALNFNQGYPFSSGLFLSSVNYPLVPTQVAPLPLAIQTGLTPPYPSFIALFDPDLKLPYTLQWNAALEQSLGRSQAVTISYVGAGGRRLLQATQLTLNAINPSFGTLFLTRGSATSDYDALQAQFQRRLSRGLQALISYTWAHALDDDSSSFSGFTAQRGNASFDIRHVFAAAATYDIPAVGNNSLTRIILGHWSVDTSFHVQSALPVDLVAQVVTNPANGAQVSVRPNVIPGVPLYVDDPTVPGGRKINQAAFTAPAAGQSGNFGRNQVRGLGAWQQDLSLRREFPLYENLKVQFRAEAFNLFNHPNFGTVQTLLTAANFGQATNMLSAQLGGLSPLYQIGGPRSLQLALKVIF
jgi:hypothetical protein